VTDKKNSHFWQFTRPVQSMNKTSGYVMVSFNHLMYGVRKVTHGYLRY